MKRDAWVLRLKEEVSSEDLDGRPYYLCDNEATDFLTANVNRAEIIWDKEEQIQDMKNYDKHMIKKFGLDSIRNFGWQNISKNFDFLKVEVVGEE
ncbi:MAG TPA: hypothetical protein VK094_00220 [Pseudogracilibacillus sp.]|nr:hypothetical protein [Pseudogracilibacillus sp.]